jgi:hypothetical protein
MLTSKPTQIYMKKRTPTVFLLLLLCSTFSTYVEAQQILAAQIKIHTELWVDRALYMLTELCPPFLLLKKCTDYKAFAISGVCYD